MPSLQYIKLLLKFEIIFAHKLLNKDKRCRDSVLTVFIAVKKAHHDLYEVTHKIFKPDGGDTRL